MATTPASNQTAEKLLIVLEAFASQPDAVKLSEMAKELDMNVSTLYRFTTSLVKSGYVNQLSDGRYVISLKLCALSDRIQKHMDVTGTLHPFVLQASRLFNESAHLAVKDGQMIVYTDNAASTAQMLTIQQHIGKTAPMYVTGIGKLFLSEMDRIALETHISFTGLKAYTCNTCTSMEALQREFGFINSNGYVLDNEECEIGVRCAAVPIRDYTGKIVAGISVSGPTTRLTDDVIALHIEELKEIAAEASRALGYTE